MTPAKPWHSTVAVIVFLIWLFIYSNHVFTGISLNEDQVTVFVIADKGADISNRFARQDRPTGRGIPAITTAAHIAEVVSKNSGGRESLLDRSIYGIIETLDLKMRPVYEVTKTPQILATSCATITLKHNRGENASAYISLETEPNGYVTAVASPGRCPA